MSETNTESKGDIQKLIKGSLHHSADYFIQFGKNVFLKKEEIRAVFYLGEVGNDHEIRIEFVDGTVRKVIFIGGDIDNIRIL